MEDVMPLKVDHDPEANALYVRLSDKPREYGRGLGDERYIDYAEDGTAIGVEFTCVSSGVDLHDVPRGDEIAAALRPLGIRELA